MAGIDGYTTVTGAKTAAKKAATQSSFTTLFGPGATVPAGGFAGVENVFGAGTQIGSMPPSSYTSPTSGGGTGVPSFPSSPAAPVAPVAGSGGAADVGAGSAYSEDELAAAIASIEAEFGLNKEQLLSDQTVVGAQYRLLVSRLNKQRMLSAMSAKEQAAGRGIFRSGILGQNLADVEQSYLEQFGQAETANQQQSQQVQSQLASLDAQKAAALAAAQQEILKQQLTEKLAAAGV